MKIKKSKFFAVASFLIFSFLSLEVFSATSLGPVYPSTTYRVVPDWPSPGQFATYPTPSIKDITPPPSVAQAYDYRSLSSGARGVAVIDAKAVAAADGLVINAVEQFALTDKTGSVLKLGTPVAQFAESIAVKASTGDMAVLASEVAPVIAKGGKFLPFVGGVFAVAQVGMIGYDLYNNIKSPANPVAQSACGGSTGSTVINSDGSVVTQCPASTPCGCGTNGHSLSACVSNFVSSYPGVINVSSPSTCPGQIVGLWPVTGGYVTWNVSPEPSSIPAPKIWSQSDIDTSIKNLSSSTLADAINVGQQNSMPLPLGLPKTYDIPFITLESPPVLSTSTIDASGTKTDTFTKQTVQITPGLNTGDPLTFKPSTVTTTSINGSPVGSSSTYNPTSTSNITSPVVIPTGGGGGGTGVDLCAAHPDILACSNDASLNDLPAVTPASSVKDLGQIKNTPIGVQSAVCPSPLVLPALGFFPSMTLDIWAPFCHFAGMVKLINIAAASILSIYIIAGGIRNV